MELFYPSFDDIRLILSVQGYKLDYVFVIREIGFWTREKSGCIPFNCKLNRSLLDSTNLRNISIYEDEIHGIRLKKCVENALPASDAKSVFKCLYHSSKSDQAYERKYIGIFAEEAIRGLLSKSGLNNIVVELECLDIFSKMKAVFPNLEMIQQTAKDNPEKYRFCDLHDRLRNNQIPVCSKSKCEIIAAHLEQLYQGQKTYSNLQVRLMNCS